MCEDAPCCGCCGYERESEPEYEPEFDHDCAEPDDEPDTDESQENEDFAGDHLDCGEDDWLDGSYEME